MYVQPSAHSAHVLANAALSALQSTAARLESEEEHWPPWKVALFFAILSGLSLPLGALFGIWMTPSDNGDEESEERIKADNVRREIVAYCLAFGAGALLFAVTVELYGEAMHELERDGYINGSIEVLVMVACAMIGALVYTHTNRWLENFLLEEERACLQDFPVVVVHEAELLRSVSNDQLPRATRRLSVVDGSAGAPGVRTQKSRVRGRSVVSFMLMDKVHSQQSDASSMVDRDSMRSMPSTGGSTLQADRKTPSHKGTPPQPSVESLGLTTKSSLDVVQEVLASPHGKESDCGSSSESEVFDGGAKSKNGAGAPSHKSPLLVGMATWLGVFIDGLPEGVLLGFLAAEGRLSLALVVSLFIANFPEAFSSACLLREAKKPVWAILGLWTLLLVLTASLAGLAAMAYPSGGEVPFHWRLAMSAIEGIAGGAMLACIAAVMLPEAYHLQGDAVGVVVVAGFITSVLVKLFGGVVSERSVDIGHSTPHGTHGLFLAAWD